MRQIVDQKYNVQFYWDGETEEYSFAALLWRTNPQRRIISKKRICLFLVLVGKTMASGQICDHIFARFLGRFFNTFFCMKKIINYDFYRSKWLGARRGGSGQFGADF